MGGALGAATGAAIGSAVGDPAAGALMGAGLGAISGGIVGDQLDQIDADNRARIAAQMGRQVQAGAVDVSEVVAMTQAGVADELIANHVRIHGVNRPLHSQDLIYLQQQGVSSTVVQAMQQPPPAAAPQPTVIHRPAPPPSVLIVEDDPWCDPYWGPHYAHRRRHHPGMTWGFSYHNH